jgi:hypothetical protein
MMYRIEEEITGVINMARRRKDEPFNPFAPNATQKASERRYNLKTSTTNFVEKPKTDLAEKQRAAMDALRARKDREQGTFEYPGTITMYYQSRYFGQDAGRKTLSNGKNITWRKNGGLTQWVANNYELLNLGNADLGDQRWVSSDNRDRWSIIAKEFLEKLFPRNSVRTCFRKSQYNDDDQWDVFPHPEDVIGRKLIGAEDELPVAQVIMQKNKNDLTEDRMIFKNFTSQAIKELDENDLVLESAIDLEPRDGANPWDMIAIPNAFATRLRMMDSTKQSVSSRMESWMEYLDAKFALSRNNEWGAKINDIAPPTAENPFYEYTLIAPRSIFERIEKGRNRGSKLHGIKKSHSTDDDVWKRKDESQQPNTTRDDEADAGNFKKLLPNPETLKDGMIKFCLRVEPPNPDQLLSGLGKGSIGHFLINDVSKELYLIKRQRDGLNRLKDLEASHNNVREWLFDIKKARPGPQNPPELEYEPLSPLNQQQDRAVRAALNSPDVFLIQGPPGTGKTTVIAEIINQATEDGKKILLASQSNLAVDNALARLSKTPNVRPIRRFSRMASADPEAKAFLEQNVITEFFIPSIREHCGKVFEDSETLRRGKESVIRCRKELGEIKDLWRTLFAELQEIEDKRRSLLSENNKLVSKNRQMLSKQDTISAAISFEKDGRLDLISKEMAETIGIDYSDIEELIKIKLQLQKIDDIGGIINLLTKLPSGGKLDPEILKLREEEKKAVSERDYQRAGELKGRIEELVSSSNLDDNEWTNWTRELTRLVDKESMPDLFELSKRLEVPDDLESIVTAKIETLREEEATIESEVGDHNSSINDIVSRLSSELNSKQDELEYTISEFEGKMNESQGLIENLDSNRNKIQRKTNDCIESWNEILQGLPNGIIDASLQDIAGTEVEQIIDAGNSWLEANQSEIESDDAWREIRKDWLKDLENPEKSTLTDLEHMYKQMINIEGVTTAFAGKKHWYKEHLEDPFDYVIIDEISKATPPEILLALLLGEKAILVGDHRQLPPLFKNPNPLSREEVTADELEDERFAKDGAYYKMVTSALFAEYFQNADSSLKSTLTAQYRMHEQIMRCTNEFYDGELTRGLSEEEQIKKKQHGFSLLKMDQRGSGLGESSELITKKQHAIWVDSTFDRDGRYCSEESPVGTTSRRNVREVRIAKYIIDQLEHQVAERKQEISPANWPNDPMLQHLDHDARLPIGFITFYADQKNAFREIANENDSWAAMRGRWPNLSVKVDTVDKFQGGERAIVFVSMVVSPEINEAKRGAFENRIAHYSYNPKDILSKHDFDDGGIPRSGTSFVRSPERINVAFSRAQNLLIILGNRYTLYKNNIEITRDDNTKVQKQIFKQIQDVIGKGGMIDGRDML